MLKTAYGSYKTHETFKRAQKGSKEKMFEWSYNVLGVTETLSSNRFYNSKVRPFDQLFKKSFYIHAFFV